VALAPSKKYSPNCGFAGLISAIKNPTFEMTECLVCLVAFLPTERPFIWHYTFSISSAPINKNNAYTRIIINFPECLDFGVFPQLMERSSFEEWCDHSKRLNEDLERLLRAVSTTSNFEHEISHKLQFQQLAAQLEEHERIVSSFETDPNM
jgi:hypothetical protein